MTARVVRLYTPWFPVKHQLWVVAGSAFMVICIIVLIQSLPMPKLLQDTVRKGCVFGLSGLCIPCIHSFYLL